MVGIGQRVLYCKKKTLITETRNRANLPNLGNAVALPLNRRDSMTPEGESQEEALEQTRPLVHPNCTIKIGNWNVRTLYRSGNIAQVTREMTSRDIDIMGISETHWIGQGKIQPIAEGDTVINSGRDDSIHRKRVGMLMSRKAASALVDWTPVNERIILARFFSKNIKLTVVYIYTPTEDAEDQAKEEFYARLQDV